MQANETHCEILSLNYNQIKCRIGPGSNFEVKYLNITIAAENSLTETFSTAKHFCEDSACTITYYEELTSDLMAIEYITEEIGYLKVGFRGTGFDSNEIGHLTINELNNVIFENTTFGYFEIFKMASGTHLDIRIHQGNAGFIRDQNGLLNDIKLNLNISNYGGQEGSVMGATEVIIHGYGFDIYNKSNNK